MTLWRQKLPSQYVFSCSQSKLINLLNYETPYQFPLAGKCHATPQHIWRLCSHYHIINKQKIHQGLIKGLYTTEESEETVCFCVHR